MIAVLVALLAMGPCRATRAARARAHHGRRSDGRRDPERESDDRDRPKPVVTNDKGVATITGLTPGKLSVTAEFPGFETRT